MAVLHRNEYLIEGMTCQNCVKKVTELFASVPSITKTEIHLGPKKSIIQSIVPLSLENLQSILGNEKYKISKFQTTSQKKSNWLKRYKPLLIIFAFLIGTSLLIDLKDGSFNSSTTMRYMMAGFFLVFSFFKLLDIEGFANSFSMYDIIAKRFPPYAYIYPFIELALGIAFVLWIYPQATLFATLAIMTIGTIGVAQSVFSKRQIQCACLGTVFNLPMSKVTIIENSLMIVMSLLMILN